MIKVLIVMLLAAVIICVQSKTIVVGDGEICGPHAEYNSCGSACPHTCANRGRSLQRCMTICRPGCFCTGNYLQNDQNQCRTIHACTGRPQRTFQCLDELLRKEYTSKERSDFISYVLPFIISLALRVEQICGQPPPLLRQKSNKTVTMSQYQCASLLACAFFCLFPKQQNRHSKYASYQNPNFYRLYYDDGRPGSLSVKVQKLKCILHYFKRISEHKPNGVLTFRRSYLSSNRLPKWNESNHKLCQVKLINNKTIEDLHGFLQVDFANKYIGGGVLGEGCVQEEIRFVICPEMLVSLLFCEVMDEQECIFLIGCERFSSYKGYSRTFAWSENYIDETPKDSWGRRLCHVVAMDALRFEVPKIQYQFEYIQRELIKASTSFSSIADRNERKSFLNKNYDPDSSIGIATGHWGCGAFNGDKQLKGSFLNYYISTVPSVER
ncbi:unnamed protein product, partial [Didymodactylos carnosus]